MDILHEMNTCSWLANALRYRMALYWVMVKSDARFNFLLNNCFPPDASATAPTTPLHKCRRLTGKNKEDAFLTRFCQSEYSLFQWGRFLSKEPVFPGFVFSLRPPLTFQTFVSIVSWCGLVCLCSVCYALQVSSLSLNLTSNAKQC